MVLARQIMTNALQCAAHEHFPNMTLLPHPADSSLELGRYRHYKGRDYELIGLARHADTEELLVVYRCLYGNYDLWVRPYADFIAPVEIGGELIPRFVYLGAPVALAGSESSKGPSRNG